MYVNNWFKPIFPLSLTSLLHKLKFLIPTVSFAPPPPLLPGSISQVKLTLNMKLITCLHVIIVLNMKVVFI